MDNVIKSSMKKSRDKLFSNVSASLKKIDQKLTELQGDVKSVHDSQLAINHEHLERLNEIMQRGKNSGTLVLSNEEIVTKIFSGLKMYLIRAIWP